MRLMVLALGIAILLAGGLAWLWTQPAMDATEPRAESGAPWISALSETSEAAFERPPADWRLQLPKDHGAHPDMRTESWSLVAHLETTEDEEIGLQFAVVRIGVTPPDTSPAESVWAIETLYRAHAIMADPSNRRAVGEERFAREIPDLAGFDAEGRTLRLDNWVLDFDTTANEGAMTLSATVQDEAVMRLSLIPDMAPLTTAAADGGGPVAGYGFTRLAVEGTLDDGTKVERLTGTAWFDHIWGELPLPGASPVSWDRLQVHLSDGSDLSLARSRRRDGRGAPILDGFVVLPDGSVSTIDDEGATMTPSRSWQGPGDATRYPVAWRLTGAELDLTIEPAIDAQAFDFVVPMWSGLVRVSGTRGGSTVTGMGTMQLTGYDEP